MDLPHYNEIHDHFWSTSPLPTKPLLGGWHLDSCLSLSADMRVWERQGLRERKSRKGGGGGGGWKQALGAEKGWERRIQKGAWTEPWSIGPDSQISLNQSERHL